MGSLTSFSSFSFTIWNDNKMHFFASLNSFLTTKGKIACRKLHKKNFVFSRVSNFFFLKFSRIFNDFWPWDACLELYSYLLDDQTSSGWGNWNWILTIFTIFITFKIWNMKTRLKRWKSFMYFESNNFAKHEKNSIIQKAKKKKKIGKMFFCKISQFSTLFSYFILWK